MKKNKLIDTAIEYRERAYAPYSNFKVGAAVEAGSGEVYGGCNVENTSYGLTICAERAAVARAVAEGERVIKKVAVVTDDLQVSMPCGACRQVIEEFGQDADVYCCDIENNCKTYKATQLLPYYNKQNVFKNKLDDLKKKG